MIIRDYAGEIPGIMKVFLAFLLFVVATTYANEFCQKDAVEACQSTSNNLLSKSPNCNAKYGAIDNLQGSLQKYANHFIDESFNFLLMSTYYGNYVKNRPGFKKLYRSLSDSLWNDGIEMIKYIDSRGGRMVFSNNAEELVNSTASTKPKPKPKPKPNWELNELQSLATALDIEKSLTKEAFAIELVATDHKAKWFDPEISFHIEAEVKDQAGCRSAYAFSVTGSIEAAYYRKTGKLVSLSEQQIVDCAVQNGCGGVSYIENIYPYVEQNGLQSEDTYPYIDDEDTCKFDNSKVVTKIDGRKYVEPGDEDALLDAVANVGPVSVTLFYFGLKSYTSGIYEDSDCVPYIRNHAVLIVGYGVENGKKFWIVKDSYGPTYGEDGYFRIVRGQNECGIAEQAEYPLIY